MSIYSDKVYKIEGFAYIETCSLKTVDLDPGELVLATLVDSLVLFVLECWTAVLHFFVQSSNSI